jgi:transposase
MSMRKPYPSDLTDGQWELVEPVITAWKARHPSVSGHQGKYAMREIGTGGPSARYLLCWPFSDDPQPERRMQLSLHVALQ